MERFVEIRLKNKIMLAGAEQLTKKLFLKFSSCGKPQIKNGVKYNMKKSIFGLSLIALSFMFSANVAANDLNLQNEIILQKNLKRIKIDRWIKDSSGTSWHITGWVDVSIGFGGVSISDYDVTMTGGGHSYHFEGKIARSENPDSTISHRIDGKLSEDGKVIPINTELKQLLIDCNEEVLKENN